MEIVQRSILLYFDATLKMQDSIRAVGKVPGSRIFKLLCALFDVRYSSSLVWPEYQSKLRLYSIYREASHMFNTI